MSPTSLPLLLALASPTPEHVTDTATATAPITVPVTLSLSAARAPVAPLLLDLVQAESAAPAPRYGAKDSTRLSVQVLGGAEGGGNYLVGAGFGFEHFIADDISLVTQFNGLGALQDDTDAAGANFVLLMRWHFRAEQNWSLFAEGGAGVAWFTDNVPGGGSKFNFTPQAALGVTFDIGDQNRAFVALGWHHISNAQIFDTNPGRDSGVIRVGFSFPF